MAGAPPPGGPPPPNPPARGFGAPAAAAVPRMEDVRVTRPDLDRRAALERTRFRIVLAACGFSVLFAAVMFKLALATIILPVHSPRAERNMAQLFEAPRLELSGTRARPMRANITDRNGVNLAVSLPTVALYANPREMTDTEEAARKLHRVLPRLDEHQLRARLANTERQFVYLARQLTPNEKLEVNRLGIPGIYFEDTHLRRYPQGRGAAQVLGGVDIDGQGIAGVELRFEERLAKGGEPLRLSLDMRVQRVVHDELEKAMAEFRAIGGTGIVMDVRTGEVIAMVSLPDYDANLVGRASAEERFNRAVTGMYEPGSTFKLQTAAMALEYGTAQIYHEFDATRPLSIGRFTISDFEGGKKRWLTFPEVLAYSSNIGAARIAQTVGPERQRQWMQAMGMTRRVGIELPEAGMPLVQPASAWKEVVLLTVAFGHGISVSPLHVMRGTAAIANGGWLVRPTILAREDNAIPADAVRVMQQANSDMMRKLMRLVVTDGFGSKSEAVGYYPGGKTGTAEKKVAGQRGYSKSGVNITAFTSIFPMHAPRYAVYMMLDEPKGNASTGGYRTAGQIVAPVTGRVIARIGPMLGMMPEIENAAQIKAALAIPMQPPRPPGAARTPPVWTPPPKPVPAKPVPARQAPPAKGPAAKPVAQPPSAPVAPLARPGERPGTPLPAATPPAAAPSPRPPARPPAPAPRDPRHEAALPLAPIPVSALAPR